jgi:hypothetical protein
VRGCARAAAGAAKTSAAAITAASRSITPPLS